MKGLEAVKEDIRQVASKIEECDDAYKKAKDTERPQVEVMRTRLEAWRDRLNIALSVLSGEAFQVYCVDDGLVVVKPSEKAAKLLSRAEELGARVESYGKLGV